MYIIIRIYIYDYIIIFGYNIYCKNVYLHICFMMIYIHWFSFWNQYFPFQFICLSCLPSSLPPCPPCLSWQLSSHHLSSCHPVMKQKGQKQQSGHWERWLISAIPLTLNVRLFFFGSHMDETSFKTSPCLDFWRPWFSAQFPASSHYASLAYEEDKTKPTHGWWIIDN